MDKFFKYIISLILISVLTFVIVKANEGEVGIDYDNIIQNFGYIETKLLESSRYTQPEDVSQERLNYYHDNMMFRPTEEFLNKYNFLSYPELEDEFLKVYFEKDSFSVIVYDKKADYYYSSRPVYQGYNGKLEGNVKNRALINSGIWIDYALTDKPSQVNIETASLYNLAKVSFVPGEQEPNNPFTLAPDSYNRNLVNVDVNRIDGNINATVDVKALNFKFDVEVKLSNGALSLRVIQESIEEDTTEFTVLSISLLPYMGATRENYFPSHFIIPDGVGALMRHNDPNGSSFEGRFYGDDLGYTNRFNNHLSVPMFGLIHETSKYGMYAHVTKGAEQSILRANNYGTANNYNRIYSKFQFREMHRRIIDRSGNGRDFVTNHRTSTDYEIMFNFLKEDANYVGIANHYKNYLLENDGLRKVEMPEDISLFTTYLMGDLEPTLFSSRRVSMTSSDEAHKMYQELKQNGVKHQQVGLLGFSSEGISSGLTKMNLAGGARKYQDLFSEVHSDDGQVYLYQNYVDPIGSSSRINEIRDIAKSVSKLLMKHRVSRDTINFSYKRYLQPEDTYYKARNDQKYLDKYDLGIVMPSLGSTLYSTYDKGIQDREESMAYYIQAAELNDHLILNQANSYLWKYMSGYGAMPIANSQYIYYTDLVPLVPIILQGVMPKYSPYLNFNALGKDRLLQMVDFNLYPQYLLTHELTFKMRNTNSSHYYSTYYQDYKDEIVENYTWLNNALRHVINADLVSREILEVGVVKNTYSNGVVIIVNYTTNPKTIDSRVVKPLEYEVIL